MNERAVAHWRGKTAEVIVNNGAGGGKNRERAEMLVKILRDRGLQVQERFTEHPLHAIDLAKQAAGNKVNLLWAVGGDGTLNEVINGAAGSDTAVAAFPTGTVNIWGRETEIPFDAEAAVDATLNGTYYDVDLLHVVYDGKERNALLGLGFGYDGQVFNSVQTAGKAREKSGEKIYLRRAVREIPHVKTPKVIFSANEESPREMTHFVQGWVLNTQRITQLGRIPVILDSKEQLDNGRALFIGYEGKYKTPLFNTLAFIRRVAADGLLKNDASRYSIKKEGTIFELHSEIPLYLQADGEPWGQATDIFVRVLPAALRVLVPQQQETTVFQQAGTPAIPSVLL